jgi:hypothetical protein
VLFRHLTRQSERAKLLKPLIAYKLELESGAPLYPPTNALQPNHSANQQAAWPETRIEAMRKALTIALHLAAKEDQKRLLNYE